MLKIVVMCLYCICYTQRVLNAPVIKASGVRWSEPKGNGKGNLTLIMIPQNNSCNNETEMLIAVKSDYQVMSQDTQLLNLVINDSQNDSSNEPNRKGGANHYELDQKNCSGMNLNSLNSLNIPVNDKNNLEYKPKEGEQSLSGIKRFKSAINNEFPKEDENNLNQNINNKMDLPNSIADENIVSLTNEAKDNVMIQGQKSSENIQRKADSITYQDLQKYFHSLSEEEQHSEIGSNKDSNSANYYEPVKKGYKPEPTLGSDQAVNEVTKGEPNVFKFLETIGNKAAPAPTTLASVPAFYKFFKKPERNMNISSPAKLVAQSTQQVTRIENQMTAAVTTNSNSKSNLFNDKEMKVFEFLNITGPLNGNKTNKENMIRNTPSSVDRSNGSYNQLVNVINNKGKQVQIKKEEDLRLDPSDNQPVELVALEDGDFDRKAKVLKEDNSAYASDEAFLKKKLMGLFNSNYMGEAICDDGGNAENPCVKSTPSVKCTTNVSKCATTSLKCTTTSLKCATTSSKCITTAKNCTTSTISTSTTVNESTTNGIPTSNDENSSKFSSVPTISSIDSTTNVSYNETEDTSISPPTTNSSPISAENYDEPNMTKSTPQTTSSSVAMSDKIPSTLSTSSLFSSTSLPICKTSIIYICESQNVTESLRQTSGNTEDTVSTTTGNAETTKSLTEKQESPECKNTTITPEVSCSTTYKSNQHSESNGTNLKSYHNGNVQIPLIESAMLLANNNEILRDKNIPISLNSSLNNIDDVLLTRQDDKPAKLHSSPSDLTSKEELYGYIQPQIRNGKNIGEKIIPLKSFKTVSREQGLDPRRVYRLKVAGKNLIVGKMAAYRSDKSDKICNSTPKNEPESEELEPDEEDNQITSGKETSTHIKSSTKVTGGSSTDTQSVHSTAHHSSTGSGHTDSTGTQSVGVHSTAQHSSTGSTQSDKNLPSEEEPQGKGPLEITSEEPEGKTDEYSQTSTMATSEVGKTGNEEEGSMQDVTDYSVGKTTSSTTSKQKSIKDEVAEGEVEKETSTAQVTKGRSTKCSSKITLTSKICTRKAVTKSTKVVGGKEKEQSTPPQSDLDSSSKDSSISLQSTTKNYNNPDETTTVRKKITPSAKVCKNNNNRQSTSTTSNEKAASKSLKSDENNGKENVQVQAGSVKEIVIQIVKQTKNPEKLSTKSNFEGQSCLNNLKSSKSQKITKEEIKPGGYNKMVIVGNIDMDTQNENYLRPKVKLEENGNDFNKFGDNSYFSKIGNAKDIVLEKNNNVNDVQEFMLNDKLKKPIIEQNENGKALYFNEVILPIVQRKEKDQGICYNKVKLPAVKQNEKDLGGHHDEEELPNVKQNENDQSGHHNGVEIPVVKENGNYKSMHDEVELPNIKQNEKDQSGHHNGVEIPIVKENGNYKSVHHDEEELPNVKQNENDQSGHHNGVEIPVVKENGNYKSVHHNGVEIPVVKENRNYKSVHHDEVELPNIKQNEKDQSVLHNGVVLPIVKENENDQSVHCKEAELLIVKQNEKDQSVLHNEVELPVVKENENDQSGHHKEVELPKVKQNEKDQIVLHNGVVLPIVKENESDISVHHDEVELPNVKENKKEQSVYYYNEVKPPILKHSEKDQGIFYNDLKLLVDRSGINVT